MSEPVDVSKLLKPKVIELVDIDNKPYHYKIHRLPAYEMKQVMALHIPSLVPKVGDYEVHEKMTDILMRYVTVKIGDREEALYNRVMVDAQVPDWEVLIKLESAVLEYNTSFFETGKGSIGFAISKLISTWLDSQTSMDSSEQ